MVHHFYLVNSHIFFFLDTIFGRIHIAKTQSVVLSFLFITVTKIPKYDSVKTI